MATEGWKEYELMDRLFHLTKGEAVPFFCPSCKQALPYTDGLAVCPCGYELTEDDRNQNWVRRDP